MDVDLDRLEALARCAPAGQWVRPHPSSAQVGRHPTDAAAYEPLLFTAWRGDGEALASFVAAASPATVLALIERLRHAENERTSAPAVAPPSKPSSRKPPT